MIRFTHALVRRPSPKYAAFYAPKGIAISDDLARKQHDAYIAALQRAGVSVTILPPHAEHHDCVFVEDTAIVFGDRALITRMNNVRHGEQRDVEDWLRSHSPSPGTPGEGRGEGSGISSLKSQKDPHPDPLPEYRARGKERAFQISHLPDGARIEGGDVLHLDDITLVGRSGRTNDAGIEALRDFMEPLGHSVQAVPVSRCLHLKSAMTYLGDHRVLIAAQLIDVKLPADYLPIFSADAHAANALRVNDKLLCASGFIRTKAQLTDIAKTPGIELIELDISEFQKGDGALTCQSILW